MNKFLLIFMLMVLIFSLTSCDSGSDSNSGFPTSDQELNNYDQYLIVYQSELRDGTVFINWVSTVEPISYELRFGNNEPVTVFWYNEEGEWSSFIPLTTAEMGVSDLGELDFFVSLNNQDFQGVLQLASPIQVTNSDFLWNENYDLSWETVTQPQLYWLSASFECEMEDDDVYNDNDWELDGDKTSFSIPKTMYNNYEDNGYYSFDVNLQAINYYSEGKFMIWSLYDWSAEYGDYWKNSELSRKNKFIEKMLGKQ